MKTRSLAALALVMMLVFAAPLLAADNTTPGATSSFYGNAIAAGLGAGLTIIGAGLGFGKIGASALESRARCRRPC
jgi:Na+/H+ antiporter NhaD/arsenite permease-like protein